MYSDVGTTLCMNLGSCHIMADIIILESATVFIFIIIFTPVWNHKKRSISISFFLSLSHFLSLTHAHICIIGLTSSVTGCKTKSSSISPKSCPQSSHSSFYLKSRIFKIAQKSSIFWTRYFCNQICAQKLLKIVQSGRTAHVDRRANTFG